MLENGVIGRIVRLIVVVGPKAGTGLDRFQIFYSFFAPGQNWRMPRMGGKNAQTTFSEFYLSMKQIPATLCLVLRVLIDWILNFSIIINFLQLTALWVNGEPGQAAQQLAEVETRTEPGRSDHVLLKPGI